MVLISLAVCFHLHLPLRIHSLHLLPYLHGVLIVFLGFFDDGGDGLSLVGDFRFVGVFGGLYGRNLKIGHCDGKVF